MSSKSEKKSNRYCDWYEKATGEKKREHVAKVIFDSVNNSNARCVYCKCLEYQEDEGTEVCIDDYFLVVSHECSSCNRYTEKKFVINYCPYCGRRL